MSEKSKIDDVKNKLDRPIVLIGLMGAGKTSVGKLLAKALDLDFYDSDDEIQKAAGCTIPEIFERYGEPHFRQGEKNVLARLMQSGPCVIATGGGAVTTPETADLIWKEALSIWLNADVDNLVERTSRHENRPLLKDNDPYEVFDRLIKERCPIYGKADVSVMTYKDSPKQTLSRVLNALCDYII